jgi:hypothetical protein
MDSKTEVIVSATGTVVFRPDSIDSVTEAMASTTKTMTSVKEKIGFAPESIVFRLELVAAVAETAVSRAEKTGSGRPEPAENTAWMYGRGSSAGCQSR